MELALHAMFLTCGVLIALWSMDIERACGYVGTVSLVMGISITILYAGSYHGLFVAAVASVLLDVTLRITRWFRGCKRLRRRGLHYQWVYEPR